MSDLVKIDEKEAPTDLMVIDNPEEIKVIQPAWMKADEQIELQNKVDLFMDAIKEDPTSIQLSNRVYDLGKEGARALMPHTNLFEKNMAEIMKDSQEGSPVNATLLKIKQEMDTINPAIIKEQPIAVRALVFFKKHRLPKADEILETIYTRRETVKSTIDGLEKGLWASRDKLMENLADLEGIYNGLLEGHRLIERDIYFGQLVHAKLSDFVNEVTEPIAKENLEQLLADITTQIINLQTEENANVQFFAGARAMVKLTRQQISNINGMTGLLKRTVLANLGLRAAATELQQSVAVTEAMKEAIGKTIADTGKQINQMGDTLTDARSKAMISLEGLEEGCRQLEEFFEKQANANREVIAKGGETSRRLAELTGKMKSRITDQSGQIGEIGVEKALPEIESKDDEGENE